ncbi:MAG: creatininase family protein [Rhodospirillales bacterium]|nr:creatininase family protein [Rhodospirillales bacterium]
MRIADMDWRMVEDYTRHDDRAVLVLGSTEQHAALSLATDAILAERIAVAAAEAEGVPVFPTIPFGLAPYFAGFPGSVTLRVATFAALLRDVLDSLKRSGFRRVLIVNGHGGNHPALAIAQEWMMDNPDTRVRLHDWWTGPETSAALDAIDPVRGHAGWMENFPDTRIPGRAAPESLPPAVDVAQLRTMPPFEVRSLLEDGGFRGAWQHDDARVGAALDVAIAETRALLAAW